VICVITITGFGDHVQPVWLITFTGMRRLRVPVDRDHGFRSKMITQSGGTCSRVRSNVITQSGDHDQPGAMV
jgi:ribosomal protein L34